MAVGTSVGMINVGVAVGSARVGVDVGGGAVVTQAERTKAVTKIEVAVLAAFKWDRKSEGGWGYLLRELWEAA